MHPELRDTTVALRAPAADAAAEGDDENTSTWQSVQQSLSRLVGSLFGAHGLLSHFPILVVGVIGVSLVMHRHWPASTKMLATVSVAGAAIIVFAYSIWRVDWRSAMFASRWFVVFLPLTLFWAGAWLRRSHRASSWVIVSTFLAFSITVSLIGATGPLPREGFEHYSFAGAVQNLIAPPPPDPDLALVSGRIGTLSHAP
jgi:hypothetical protein